MIEEREPDPFVVYRNDELIGVEFARNWVEASKQAARQEKEDTGKVHPWTHYDARYIAPMHRKKFGLSIPEKRTKVEE